MISTECRLTFQAYIKARTIDAPESWANYPLVAKITNNKLTMIDHLRILRCCCIKLWHDLLFTRISCVGNGS